MFGKLFYIVFFFFFFFVKCVRFFFQRLFFGGRHVIFFMKCKYDVHTSFLLFHSQSPISLDFVLRVKKEISEPPALICFSSLEKKTLLSRQWLIAIILSPVS